MSVTGHAKRKARMLRQVSGVLNSHIATLFQALLPWRCEGKEGELLWWKHMREKQKLGCNLGAQNPQNHSVGL